MAIAAIVAGALIDASPSFAWPAQATLEALDHQDERAAMVDQVGYSVNYGAHGTYHSTYNIMNHGYRSYSHRTYNILNRCYGCGRPHRSH